MTQDFEEMLHVLNLKLNCTDFSSGDEDDLENGKKRKHDEDSPKTKDQLDRRRSVRLHTKQKHDKLNRWSILLSYV